MAWPQLYSSAMAIGFSCTYFINNLRGDEAMGSVWSYLETLLLLMAVRRPGRIRRRAIRRARHVQVVELARQYAETSLLIREVGRVFPDRSVRSRTKARGRREKLYMAARESGRAA